MAPVDIKIAVFLPMKRNAPLVLFGQYYLARPQYGVGMFLKHSDLFIVMRFDRPRILPEGRAIVIVGAMSHSLSVTGEGSMST